MRSFIAFPIGPDNFMMFDMHFTLTKFGPEPVLSETVVNGCDRPMFVVP